MRASSSLLLPVPLAFFLAVGCGSGSGAPSTDGQGGSAASSTGGSAGSGGSNGTGGSTTTAGNPNGSCSAGVPSNGKPVDVSKSTVVGMGTPESCTFAALDAAVANAGNITFDCGGDPVRILLTATLKLSITKDTVIDGGNEVTLDGGHAVQLLSYDSGNWQASETRVTLQHLTLVNGKTNPIDTIPTAPAGETACSQGYDDGQGGALYMRDGNLTVIDCVFSGNQAAPLGPDTGGGAIYIQGSKHGAVIVGSTFANNSGANAGAVGALYAELDIYDSLFQDNMALGHDANNNDTSMTMCTVMNNGQYEIGSGGNGGAIYGDRQRLQHHLVRRRRAGQRGGPERLRGRAVLHQRQLRRDPDHHRHHDEGQHGRPLDQRQRRQCHRGRDGGGRERHEHHHHQFDVARDVATPCFSL
jgi:hypothetical protein